MPGKNQKAGSSSPKMDYVTKRMLSARRIKINELRNEIEDLQQQLNDKVTENRTLQREQHLREKALLKFESEENDMANTLQKHNAEVRVLKETIRKNKGKYLINFISKSQIKYAICFSKTKICLSILEPTQLHFLCSILAKGV